MKAGGVFAVSRGLFDHPFFATEPFTEREAWMWLLAEAAWRPRRIRARFTTIELQRGQLAHATRFMAAKWQWSEARVRRFLKRLKIDAMIDAQSDAQTTLITICNYSEYQKVGLPADADNDAENDAQATRARRKAENIQNIEAEKEPLRGSENAPIEASPSAGRGLEAEVYAYGKSLLGKTAGGVITKLRKHHHGDLVEAMATLRTASTKSSPIEWIGGVMRGTVDLARERREAEIYESLR